MRLLTNGRKIYVIEPHADDAFLSLHAHIEEWVKKGFEVTIITVYARTRKRADDAAAYARAVGAYWIGLNYTEAGGGLQCVPANLPGNAFSIIDWNSHHALVQQYDITVLVPLAIGHPEHEEVRNAVERSAAKAGYKQNLQYYLDSPYMVTQALNENVNDALRGMTIVSYRKPHARKWRHCDLFKDQAKFMYMNKHRFRETFELVVKL
jgi:LmbE family N-acetylglucosaminyl deacetylase